MTTTQVIAPKNQVKSDSLVGITISSPKGNFALDEAVIEALPKGDTVISTERYDNSAWSSTARITVSKEAGGVHDYFVKIISGDLAPARVLGEYSCMLELWQTMPNLVPRPRVQGQCYGIYASYFICDYLKIDHRSPNAVQLGAKVAELHRVSRSPTGMFGFHVMPYDGKLPLKADWVSEWSALRTIILKNTNQKSQDMSWQSFYKKVLDGVYQLDTQVNGKWKELDDAMNLVLEKVIPRLLGPLEADGRTVKPCLIHGDLWEKNIGTDLTTGDIYVFDSRAYYAHHEMAMGMWRVDHNHMEAKEYRDEYFRNFEPDEPVEEFDDRNRFYAIKERIMYSAHVPGTKTRAQALDDMMYLIDKYAGE